MDVRCEKCQTEYELDEARLKPGGVTVKCTNCGHMFKIRRRPTTNAAAAAETRTRSPSAGLAGMKTLAGGIEPDEAARQWLIRLENGEQKSCRELASLQQWIVACVVTRESLISRTGKTWKRLGDIGELAQYFEIADEARESRAKPTTPHTVRDETARGTMLGVGATATAAGGTIVPDDGDDDRRTGPIQPPLRPTGKIPSKTPPMGSNAAPSTPPPIPHEGPRKATPTPPPLSSPSLPARRPLTTPPPPPKKSSQSGPLPVADGSRGIAPSPPPAGNRATGTWATEGADRVARASVGPDADRASRPFVGKLSAIPDEPAFAGLRRTEQPVGDSGTAHSFDDEDDDLVPRRRSSNGILILLMVTLIGAAAAAAVYLFAIRKPKHEVANFTPDALGVAQTPDATPIVTPVIDAAESTTAAIEHALGELAGDNEVRLKVAIEQLPDDETSRAIHALYDVALAQALVDRAGLAVDWADADKLRKESKRLVIDAATAAQKAHKAAPDDPAANLALAHVLRLQGKPARDVKRYVDAARTKAGDWGREVDLAEALLLARDGKLDDAKAAFLAIDSGPGKLETSNDVRARFHLALIALAQGRTADAKPLAEQVLAAQPEHVAARALAAKLDTVVAKTDPLPPEDPKQGSAAPGPGPGPGPAIVGGDYDTLVRKGDAVADSNCTTATEFYNKALEKKPNGVEALTGLGYCQLAAKNYSSAHSKFRTALVISPRYEPALAGIAEAYQQQGRKDDAISSWRRYLEAYPGSKRALAALERLGVKDDAPNPPTGSGSGSGSGSATDTPTPTPTPTLPPAPTPAPAPPPAGDG